MTARLTLYTTSSGPSGAVRAIQVQGPRVSGSRALRSVIVRYHGQPGTQHLYVSDCPDKDGQTRIDLRVYDNRRTPRRQYAVLDPVVALRRLGLANDKPLADTIAHLAAGIPPQRLPHLDRNNLRPYAVLLAARYPLLRTIAEQRPEQRLPLVTSARIAAICETSSLRAAAILIAGPEGATRAAGPAMLRLLCTERGLPSGRLLSLVGIGRGLDRERFTRLLAGLVPDGDMTEVPDRQVQTAAQALQTLGAERHERLAAAILARPDAREVVATIADRPSLVNSATSTSVDALLQAARRPNHPMDELDGLPVPTLAARLEVVIPGQDERLREVGREMHNCIGTYATGGLRELRPDCVFLLVKAAMGRAQQALHVAGGSTITDWAGPFNRPMPYQQRHAVLEVLRPYGIHMPTPSPGRLQPAPGDIGEPW